MKLLSAAESREIDRLSQQRYGIDSYRLMTRAGEAVAESLARRFPAALGQGVVVIAGKGNNGGDGMVAARCLLASGARVGVVLLARRDELRGDAARACADLTAAGGSIVEVDSEAPLLRALGPPGVTIDAIFGTGLNAKVEGLARRAIEMLNHREAPLIAVDICSGVNADTGAVMGIAAHAALTVTFGLAKYGHVSYPGAELCGELEIAEIGFAPEAIADVSPSGRLLEAADVGGLIRSRAPDAHKGMCGHPLVIAGSAGKSGAALLASRGALRMGAGLVTAAVPASVQPIVAAGQAELMTEAISDRDGHFDASSARTRLGDLISGKDALIVGPGIGLSDDTKALIAWLVSEATSVGQPLLIDADGLNAVAALGCELLRRARGPLVLTPHPGEMARLLGASVPAVAADRISAARRLSELSGAHVVLKGARSVIASPSGVVHINSSGNPGMATPGMGDVLSGMVGALLGQKFDPMHALALGVFLHGAAADRVARRIGPAGYLASDLLEELPRSLAALGAEAQTV